MDPLVELITLWQKYSKESSSPSVESFCTHVLNRKKTDQPADKSCGLAFARQLGKTSSLVKAYFKIAIKEEMPDIELGWYFLLDAIGDSNEVRKTDVVSFSLMLEPTTTIDILNRMLKAGLISERVDPTDKRARLIKITNEGRVLMQKLTQLFENITSKLFTTIHTDDILKMTTALDVVTHEQINVVRSGRTKKN
ncbi:winged helix DNA-binding protein [Chryseobacterium sp. Bi04]|uniref:MarR family winged helix-turn-helix transcriptional regulator n=1 Tax=Chryseobacterium sp. Bi04 TaxID=2822345 RepID=UPI001E19A6EB|nr:winged helix DNA-binding protein [Chryseobacterium sp. Bi04]CAH0289767.1 Transcriptional regulator SlyA [Chryseobacterium sp. Bi04]